MLFEAALAEAENRIVVLHVLEAKVALHPDGDGGEEYVVCKRPERGALRKAMPEQRMTSSTEELINTETTSSNGQREGGRSW